MQHSVTRQGQLVGDADQFMVRGADATVHTLTPGAAAIWTAADGERQGSELLEALSAVETEATLERVFSLLDQLSERGLITGRLAPPTEGVDRRGLFQRFALGAAAAAVTLPVLTKATSASAATGDVCLDDMALHRHEATQKKAVRKLRDREAQESATKAKLDSSEQGIKTKLEEKVKGGKSTEGLDNQLKLEQETKKASYQDEQKIKGEPGYSSRQLTRERKAKYFAGQRRFGVGPSAVFVDLPGDDQFVEGTIELSEVAMDDTGKTCTLQLGITVAEAKDRELLALHLAEGQKSGATFGLQWGAEGEFAALGTVQSFVVENVAFDASTSKPTRQRAQVVFGVSDETYAVGADDGGF